MLIDLSTTCDGAVHGGWKCNSILLSVLIYNKYICLYCGIFISSSAQWWPRLTERGIRCA